ncbi:MAG: rod shape-determining protein MreC [Bacteroidia bacterium]|nr:rod shape-determining protein MreC [Bacteroidia bacterium]
MERLFSFIISYGSALYFLLLQIAALLLLFGHNNYHNQWYTEQMLKIAGAVQDINARLVAHINLSDQNDKLVTENILLKNKVNALKTELELHKHQIPYSLNYRIIPDSLVPYNRFEYIPARALHNTIGTNFNYILLNIGSKQGVRKGMGVFSPEGVAGQVIETSSDFSLAMSLLNKDFKLSAKVKNRSVIGTITWDGASPEFASLKYIPVHFHIQQGDTVFTSHYSTIFPEDYIVGRVYSISTKEDDGFYNIKVQLSTDFYNIDYLYLVQHEAKQSIDSLIPKTTPVK